MLKLKRGQVLLVTLLLSTIYSQIASAQVFNLPEPESSEFCSRVQQLLANTNSPSTNTVFDNMPDYRSSKPSVSPLNIYQVVTYSDAMPMIVSCKVKTADHLRSEYGDDNAGKQRFCPDVTRITLQAAIRELETENPSAAETAQTYIVEDTEPFSTGQSYLSDFEAVFEGADGNIHIASYGLQTDWENWLFWLLPERLRGQTYCHLPTVDYIKAIATGAMEPGSIIHTRDDAPTRATPDANPNSDNS